MKVTRLIPAVISSLIMISLPAYGVETRCGWLQNPTPANWYLTDAEGTWTISTQGGEQASGMENIPDLETAEYVKTNGNYGYTCACLNADTNNSLMRVTYIQSVELLSLSTCQQDSSLPGI